MKKILLIPAVLSVLFMSCSTTKVSLEGKSPVVIISVKGNPTLPWYEKDSNGKLKPTSQGLLSKIIDDKFNYDDPEIVSAEDRLNYAEESLRKTFKETLNIEVLEKDQVVNLKTYKSISEGLLSSMNTSIAAEGYKPLDSVSGIVLNRIYKETQSKGSVILKFDFYKKLKSGSKTGGIIVPVVVMRGKVYDERGREIFSKEYTATGDDFKYVRKDYDKEEFVSLYQNVIDNVINMFAMELM